MFEVKCKTRRLDLCMSKCAMNAYRSVDEDCNLEWFHVRECITNGTSIHFLGGYWSQNDWTRVALKISDSKDRILGWIYWTNVETSDSQNTVVLFLFRSCIDNTPETQNSSQTSKPVFISTKLTIKTFHSVPQ